MMATPQPMQAVPAPRTREMVKQIHRVTREKRNLWYVLKVLQQPERARACGSGMKGKFGAMSPTGTMADPARCTCFFD
jgi:hypothetical protein